MEDLTIDYPECPDAIDLEQIKICLRWLAYFHGNFMDNPGEKLWSIGTYWNLDTRPDEYAVMDNTELRQSAASIDALLNNCTYKTLLHGDAKLANYCFSEDGERVAMVDFQYVGRGCGMKDVAYFFSSCMTGDECEVYETELLDFYFEQLSAALLHYGKRLDRSKLEAQWRSLYDVAWADFQRFLNGWSPQHWKINDYTEKLTNQVVSRLLDK